MTWLEAGDVAARVGLGIATLLAWRLAAPSRFPPHRPVALALAAALAADIARLLLRVLVLAPARAAGRTPFVGFELVGFHASAALFLAFPALSIGLAMAVFLRRRPWAVAALWAVASGIQGAAYPAARGPRLMAAYDSIYIFSAAAQVVAAVVFFWRRGIPTPPQRVALVLIGADIAALFGPWLAGDPVRDWYTSGWPSAIAWAVVGVYEWRVLAWCSARIRAGGF